MGFFLPHRTRRVFSIFKFSKLFPFSDFFEASPGEKCLSSTSTISQSPAICCALLRSLFHSDVDKRGRRAYNTWDEGRKKTQANPNQKAPIRPSTARAPRGQLTCRVQKRLGNLEFLAAEAPPQSTGMGGRVQKASPNNPTTRADY